MGILDRLFPKKPQPPAPGVLQAEVMQLWMKLSFVVPQRLKVSGQELNDDLINGEMTSAVLKDLTAKYSISRDDALQAIRKAREIR